MRAARAVGPNTGIPTEDKRWMETIMKLGAYSELDAPAFSKSGLDSIDERLLWSRDDKVYLS